MRAGSQDDDRFLEIVTKFDRFVRDHNEGGVFSFNDGFIDKYEGYKKEIPLAAKKILESETWKKNWIGTGKILNCVVDAVEYGTQSGHNNLVHWNKRRVFFEWFFDKPEYLQRVELLFFNLYIGDNDNEGEIFDELCDQNALGAIYDLISYLYFIKNPDRYVPNKPNNFQDAFRLLGEHYYFRMSLHCSWENYQTFLGRLEEIRQNLVKYYSARYDFNEEISLIDAHSFCWIISHNLEKIKKTEPTDDRSSDVSLVHTDPPTGFSEENLKPKGPRKFKAISNKERKKQELKNERIGSAGEMYVWDAEKKILKTGEKPYLADMMYHASKELGDGLGYDIISFTPEGKVKFIEVKTTTSDKNSKFFISDNELEFSELNPEYYYLYRLYNFNKSSEKNPHYFLHGKMREKLALYPIQYFALPRE